MTFCLKDLEGLREGWDFEAKKAAGRDGRGKVPDSFWETYSAMANARGGKVVLGVRERADGRLEVHGVTDPHGLERDLWDLLHNRGKVSVNLLTEADVRIESIDGKSVLVMDIRAARREERPVFIGRDYFAGTWIRGHEGDRKLSRERVRRMLADADRDRPRDSLVLVHHGLEDLHEPTLAAYRRLLSARKADHPFLRQDSEAFLRSLGVCSCSALSRPSRMSSRTFSSTTSGSTQVASAGAIGCSPTGPGTRTCLSSSGRSFRSWSRI